MGGRLMLRWICKSSSPRQALCIISQAVHNATSATPQSWKSPSSLYYKSLENTNFEKQINNSTQLLWHDSITQHVLCMSSILHGGFQTISPQRLPIEQPQTHKAHHTSSRWQLHHLPIVHHPTSYSQKNCPELFPISQKAYIYSNALWKCTNDANAMYVVSMFISLSKCNFVWFCFCFNRLWSAQQHPPGDVSASFALHHCSEKGTEVSSRNPRNFWPSNIVFMWEPRAQVL